MRFEVCSTSDQIFGKWHTEVQIEDLFGSPRELIRKCTIPPHLKRFEGGRSGRKVTAFAGLAVMQHSSGQKERHWGISKAGPPLTN
ncbi:MAG: transposase [Candidatus Heimdallarchaeota archaeon]|nr:transposase [Candidatus Heimdallarchaeota archaeon]